MYPSGLAAHPTLARYRDSRQSQTCTCSCGSGKATSASTALKQTFYPTPPSSPELDDPPTVPSTEAESKQPPSTQSPRPKPRPIHFSLDTPHSHPHAPAFAFRLSSTPGILGVLGGTRVLSLPQWDTMPFVNGAVANGAVLMANGTNNGPGESHRYGNGYGARMEEDSVEQILGGKAEVKRSKQERISSIFVQPPTPERETPPASAQLELPPRDVPQTSSSTASASVVTRSSSPPLMSTSATTSPPSSSVASLMPLQVLPEVRSPPRRNLAMTADSLQLNLRRGRRPRLFGFTEIPDSGSSSAASSANNSRSNSPERHASPLGLSSLHGAEVKTSVTASVHASSTPGGPGPGATLPRRGPLRTRSDTHLPTIASNMSVSSTHSHSSRLSPGSHASHSTLHSIQSNVHGHGNGHTRSQSASAHTPTTASTASSSATAPAPNHRRGRDNGLKLDFSGIIPVNQPIDSSSTYVPSPYSAKLIRKKSGELVKPALKYGGPLTASGTPMTERSSPRFGESSTASSPRYGGSKSLPATPSCPKYVHFDSQLERVKLFNKDHKPQVVSRTGSPTQYTTSEGEEFPFPSTDEEGDSTGKGKKVAEEEKVLSIRLPNFPAPRVPDGTTDLTLESLHLDPDRTSLRGVVLVRNFAYSKWVAVRFTLDWWQTTSEVSATHKESIQDGAFDRFAFTIKLQDILERIEEKTLFMCVRYNSEGRELWDSNNGENYQVIFEKVAPPSTAVAAGADKAGAGKSKRNSQWGIKGSSKEEDRMADLREKLSRLEADDDERQKGPLLSPNRSTFLSPGRGVSFGFGAGSPTGSPRKGHSALIDDPQPPAGLPNGGLAARYDFGKSFRSSPDARTSELPNVRTGLLAFDTAASTKDKSPSPTRSGSSSGARERPGLNFFSPQYSPMGLPDSKFSADFFAPPSVASASARPAGTAGTSKATSGIVGTGVFDSPVPMSSSAGSTSTMESPLPVPASRPGPITVPPPLQVPEVPNLTVQGPSPPPPDSPIATAAILSGRPAQTATARRPSLSRSKTSPAVLPNSLPSPSASLTPRSTPTPLSSSVEASPSPPLLTTSVSSSTSSLPDPNDSPPSPASPALSGVLGVHGMQDMSISRFAESRARGSDDSMASYSSFIEQFCWGGGAIPTTLSPPAPSSSEPRRAHSSSTLDEYFAHGSTGSGFTTPRPAGAASPSATAAHGPTPSTQGSFYSAYSSFSPEFPGTASPGGMGFIYHHSHHHQHQHHHHYHHSPTPTPLPGVYGSSREVKRRRDDGEAFQIESTAAALNLSVGGMPNIASSGFGMGVPGTASPPVRASG